MKVKSGQQEKTSEPQFAIVIYGNYINAYLTGKAKLRDIVMLAVSEMRERRNQIHLHTQAQ